MRIKKIINIAIATLFERNKNVCALRLSSNAGRERKRETKERHGKHKSHTHIEETHRLRSLLNCLDVFGFANFFRWSHVTIVCVCVYVFVCFVWCFCKKKLAFHCCWELLGFKDTLDVCPKITYSIFTLFVFFLFGANALR